MEIWGIAMENDGIIRRGIIQKVRVDENQSGTERERYCNVYRDRYLPYIVCILR